MKTDNLKYCIVIPCYNHGRFIRAVIEKVSDFNLPIILIDDASDVETAAILSELATQYDLILHRHSQNLGKGGALKTALYLAEWLGFSHILQVDADGQHDLQDIPRFIEISQHSPQALVSGQPIYDHSVPKLRYYGRYLTHVWVWLETLSFDIKDSLCGFRVYPVANTLAIVRQVYSGNRMEFDIEILVQYYWRYQQVRFLPTNVIYPKDGISHFDQWRDNLRLSKMHCRLLLQLWRYFPALLRNKFT
ncbi:glycosyltransferase family 2 protein [Testudinibacter sp. TR-2022]|uniref:glycosyltransferase family 2 protein n=1 Tax=Testudinibacter sp. TR-2022 TaxID=2585029 RepID=UPI001118C108|nr:glycosyltransferase family 2 protein [Testudinibacter sp. TR-2022]TNH05998.1 glycosyltransferase family 2 protein [Pasteurellaceae bacterium Phil11]TNH24301.1 glycosyltransferase family 2 protein [Testudinibacter sp. TR-2022]TNH26892.1 glycosyltransferase family 2 protein [Testudinibacter sp. TR-2022]